MKNKKAQGMPMNVVILAIIVIVVLIILLIILVGGTSQFTQALRNIFVRPSAQSLELTVKDCEALCESAKALPTDALKAGSNYCSKTFLVELEGRRTKVGCNAVPTITEEEKSRGVLGASSLSVVCESVQDKCASV